MIRLTIVITLLCTFAFMLGTGSGETKAYAEVGEQLLRLEKKAIGD